MDSEARRFLEALFADKRDNQYVLLWTLPEKRSYWFQVVEPATRFAESMVNHDLYVGVGLSPRDYGTNRRCASEEITGIVGLWVDLDLKSDAHSKLPLPSTIDEALGLLPPGFPPTIVVRTGNGLHAWWLFRESWIFTTDNERQEAAALVGRFQSLIRLNAAGRGWAIDRLSDLARVLRVPGTHNCKDPQNPKAVTILSQTDRRYNPADFTEFLDDHGVPNTDEQEKDGKGLEDAGVRQASSA